MTTNSGSARLSLRAVYHGWREISGAWAARRGAWATVLHEFLVFGIKQAWACLFGGLMVALLIGTHLWYPSDVALTRYDFLTLAAVAIQVAMLWLRLETWDEAKVIMLFHVAGTAMEVFKTAVGSWIYPEASVLRIGNVPLFTGFMYAAVGSYIARVWREFDFQFTHHPPLIMTGLLSLAIYGNFFLHHYWWDARYVLMALVAVAFGRCWVHFRIDRVHRRMPLLLGFTLVALFIWLAENIGTLTRTWIYPNQLDGWHLVSVSKLGSWFMLMIMSYVMVTLVSRPQPYHPRSCELP